MMPSPSLEVWLRGRVPPPPATFRGFVEPSRPDALATPEALAEAGVEALRRAEADEAAAHGGAFELLAADALITYACEAALDDADVDAALARVRAALSK